MKGRIEEIVELLRDRHDNEYDVFSTKDDDGADVTAKVKDQYVILSGNDAEFLEKAFSSWLSRETETLDDAFGVVPDEETRGPGRPRTIPEAQQVVVALDIMEKRAMSPPVGWKVICDDWGMTEKPLRKILKDYGDRALFQKLADRLNKVGSN